MPKLDEICRIPEELTGLLDELHRKEKEELEERIRREEEWHRKRHVFGSYGEAVEWMKNHPGHSVEWHCKSLTYIEEDDIFESFEQDYSPDGIMVYDVVRRYTEEELLSGIDEMKRRLLEIDGKFDESSLLDKWGKLDYVYIHNQFE